MTFRSGTSGRVALRTAWCWLTVVLSTARFAAPAPAADEPAALPPPPLLQTLVKTDGGVTIAYGTDPRSEEAALRIFQAAHTIAGTEQSVRIMKAADFDASHFRFTGPTHVIAVGTLADNVVLQGRNWLPTWWLDRDWYYQQYPYAVAPDQVLPYQPTSGFIAAGYGEWRTGERRIGVVEVDRSEYFMEWMVRSRYEEAAGGPIRNGNHPSWRELNQVTSPTYPADFPLRLMVRITGSGAEGVLAASTAFLANQLLGGVVLADGVAADSGPTMFTLPGERYATSLPFVPPTEIEGYTYLGWLLPSAFEYDGFRHDAGVSPRRMVRVKYKPPFGITNFWTTPHRRAGQFEVCVVYFDKAGDAERARQALENTLAATPGGKEGKITGLHMAVAAPTVLILESLPEPAGQKLLEAYRNLKWP